MNQFASWLIVLACVPIVLALIVLVALLDRFLDSLPRYRRSNRG